MKKTTITMLCLAACFAAADTKITWLADVTADRAETVTGPQSNVITAAAAHIPRTDNPHGVTAPQIGALTTEVDPVAGPRLDLIEPEMDKWSAAYGWGNHALAGYLLPVALEPYATTAALTVHTNRADNPHGVTAAQIGALTSELDPIANAKLVVHTNRADNPHNVTAIQIGALTAETDPVAGPRMALIESETNKWNAAYGWGNHALAGYLLLADLAPYATTGQVAQAAAAIPRDRITTQDGSQWIDATGGVWRVTSSEGFWRLTVAGTEYGCVTNASYDIPSIFSIWQAGGMVRYWSTDGNASVMYDGVSTSPNIHTTVRCSPTTVETNYNQFAVYEEDLSDGAFEFYSDGRYTHIILEWFGTPVFTTQHVDGVAWQSDIANADMAALRTYHYGSRDVVESPAEWFVFDGAGTITAFNWETGRENVVIPWEIGGVAVTAIGASAFRNLVTYQGHPVVSVVAPQTVTAIGGSAFDNCHSLTSVIAPQATAIGGSAFAYCTALESIDLPQATSIGGYAFAYDNALTSVAIPQVASIGFSAFSGCLALNSINLPQVTTVEEHAFYNCTSLTAVHMGQNAPAQAASVFASITQPPNVYVTDPQATGWGDTWNDAPVVRPPLYGSSVTAQAITLGGDTITEWPGGGGELDPVANAALMVHTNRADNPHSVTAVQIGALTEELDPVANAALVVHTNRTDNPHNLTAADVGALASSGDVYMTLSDGATTFSVSTSIGERIALDSFDQAIHIFRDGTVELYDYEGERGVREFSLFDVPTYADLSDRPTLTQIAASNALPYTAWTGTVTPVGGTATITAAHGNMPVLVVPDGPGITYVTIATGTYAATSGVSRVSLSIWAGENTIEFLTDEVDYATAPDIPTDGWGTILFRRVSNGRWKGVGL